MKKVSISPNHDVFTVIVSPTCPVAGYANCLLAGPEPLRELARLPQPAAQCQLQDDRVHWALQLDRHLRGSQGSWQLKIGGTVNSKGTPPGASTRVAAAVVPILAIAVPTAWRWLLALPLPRLPSAALEVVDRRLHRIDPGLVDAFCGTRHGIEVRLDGVEGGLDTGLPSREEGGVGECGHRRLEVGTGVHTACLAEARSSRSLRSANWSSYIPQRLWHQMRSLHNGLEFRTDRTF